MTCAYPSLAPKKKPPKGGFFLENLATQRGTVSMR